VGAERIIAHIEKQLNIKVGETTTDGMFTLKTVECMGACGYAPMMQVGEFYHEHLTEEKVDQFLADCRAGKVKLGTWKHLDLVNHK
jgi:NADH-quinone oxidoreductase subunit E